MTFQPRSTQRGQSTAEFVAAMALFLPLAMGIIYAGKYADIKHQAVQASRYAALERAMDPNRMESDQIVQNETVARFFPDAGKHNIGLEDQATAATAGDENPNWNQLNGDPMIGKYADITVAINGKSLDSTFLAPIDASASTQFKKLSSGTGIEADVEVPIANIAHFLPLSNINIKVGATTVMAGDPWNAGGASNVNDHIGIAAVPAKAYTADPLFGPLQTLLQDLLYQPLSGTDGPQFGCVKPDVVPQGVAPNASYNTNADPNAAGVNQCYSN